MTTEFNAKRNTLLRQAVHADPELIETATGRIQSYIVRRRLEAHDTALITYQKGGWWRRRSTLFSLRSFVRNCWRRLLRRMRMRKRGYWDSCQGLVVSHQFFPEINEPDFASILSRHPPLPFYRVPRKVRPQFP